MLCCRCLPSSSLHVLGTFGSLSKRHISFQLSGWVLGAFLGWWPPSAMWVGPLIFLWPPPGCLNNPIFSNLRLSATFWAHFLCHRELRPTSVGHHFSFLNSSWGLTEGKHYYHVTFLIFFFIAIFSPNFFRLVCYCSVALFQFGN